MNVYNTLSRAKEPLVAINKELKLFVCGPTVYDFAHIGHARSYTVYDVIVKYLRYKGFKVKYIQNITDIDDKIINRAKELGKEPADLAKQFEQAYYEDMASLGINSVDAYLPASKHIPEIISQIQRLLEKGYAYVAPDGVWFDVQKFKDYGKLSKQNIEELKKHRIEPSQYKKFFADFSLWKAQKPGEPAWDSPWGKGRPGWHIEDTAIAEKYFGPQYDMHGGGQDLIFPHHEAEIAQMEALSGKSPMVRYWLHNGFLLVNGEKMSKSLGNFVTIRDALKEWSAEVLRLFFLSTHYRAPINYSKEALLNAKRNYAKLQAFVHRLNSYRAEAVEVKEQADVWIKDFTEHFEAAMDDDFNTPLALSTLHAFMTKVNAALDKKSLDKKSVTKIKRVLGKIDSIFGLGLKKLKLPKLAKADLELIKKRELARAQKDWKTADEIRAQLKSKGIILEDTEFGVLWRIEKM
ncbi:MAG: cysteine--tRNA ligase [Candidatus Nanoarchaeia archaeon]